MNKGFSNYEKNNKGFISWNIFIVEVIYSMIVCKIKLWVSVGIDLFIGGCVYDEFTWNWLWTFGDDMQFVEIELDPRETVVAEAEQWWWWIVA